MKDSRRGQIFREGDSSADLLVSWWGALDRERGDRAQLRRARGSSDVVFCASFHGLLQQLRRHGFPLGSHDADSLACVAGLASHVRTNSPQRTIGQQMAAPRPPGANARISGLRFRRLLAVSEREELYPLLIRALALLDGSVNLVALANGVFWWNEKTKKTWAYAYYETSPSEK